MGKLLASVLAAGALIVSMSAVSAADTGGEDAQPNSGVAELGLVEQVAVPMDIPRESLRREAHRKLRAAEREARERRQSRRSKSDGSGSKSSDAPDVAVPGALQAIAACESGGNPSAIGGGGAYRGKYQFDRGTWASVGGSGDPAAAPEAEQDRRAAMLYARAGASPWPTCG